LNLDLTVNPDYSQVEVDRQVTNLDRFELFFPEKRQFYLENSDLFARLGSDNLRPFFSRRIGLNSPVLAGARLSGKIGKDWRVGLMDIQTRSNGDIQPVNFTVAALQRQVFSYSNVTAFLVNKQLAINKTDSTLNKYYFNRVAGLEYNLASANNRWTGKAFYHQSFYPGAGRDAAAMSASITRSTQHLIATLSQSWVGSDYLAEAGYIRRRGYYELNPVLQYKFYPSGSKIANHGTGFKFDLLTDHSMKITDGDIQLLYQVEWLNRSILLAYVRQTYIRLQFPYDPTNSDSIPLQPNESFKWNEIGSTIAGTIIGFTIFGGLLAAGMADLVQSIIDYNKQSKNEKNQL
jgi:hypothetical protein